jgi:hypothetical protein
MQVSSSSECATPALVDIACVNQYCQAHPTASGCP